MPVWLDEYIDDGGGYCCNCWIPPGGVVAGVVGIERLFITVSMARDPLPPWETTPPPQNELSEPPTPITLEALEGGVGKEMLLCNSGRGWPRFGGRDMGLCI
jgi:hypothetical protein